jgi:hypothetical protein
MLTNSKIALSVAVFLSAAGVSASPHAFAESNYLDRDGYAPSYQNGKGERTQMNRLPRGNALHGEHERQPDAPQRWIEDPASPGG